MAQPPLRGLTVVSVEQAVAAPFATRQLADLGARVIKVERPGAGDFARAYDTSVHGESSYFVWLNRSKESVTLDFKDEVGKDVLRRLIATADVFVCNLAPGALERSGFGPRRLAERHERLVVCQVSGYGSDGEWADRKAYDLLVQAEAGLMSVTGTGEGPVRAGISVADIAAGMYAYSGILAALLRRSATGRGSVVDVSLMDSLVEWMGSPLYYAMYTGEAPAPAGAHHSTIAPYGPFTTADGELVIAVQNDREWSALCDGFLASPELVDDPRFATNSARVAHRAELHTIMHPVVAAQTTDEVSTRLDALRIANARVSQLTDLPDHHALRSRDRWREVATPGGRIRALTPPAGISEVQPVMGAVPALGEHTGRVLDELGIGAALRAELAARNVI